MPFSNESKSRLTAYAVTLGALLLAGLAAAVHAKPSLQPELRPSGMFEQNLGQFPERLRYRTRLGDLTASVEEDGSLHVAARGSEFKLEHAGGLRPSRIDASDLYDYRTNYFRAGSQPVVDVAHFRRIVVRNVYPGVDVAYHADNGVLEFDYELAPGADTAAIRMRIGGGRSVRLDDSGNLLIAVGENEVMQRKPIAYQTVDGQRVQVACEYRLQGSEVTLALDRYDQALRLVIDPVIEYSSYLGGTNSDFVKGVAMGADGAMYVVGSTTSTNFPVVAAIDSTLGGASDAFVTKINASTGKAVFSTYVGGSNADYGMAVAVDSSNAVYFTGVPLTGFPTTSGAYQTTASGAYGFVAKVAAAGNALTYSTFVRGTQPKAIAIDAQGRAVITGSAGTSFVTTAGAFQTTFGGLASTPAGASGDAFALMLTATGNAAVFATFIGGDGVDEGRGIAIDAAGRVVVAGYTESTNFAAAGGRQTTLSGPRDGFVLTLAANGASRVAGTYLGGTKSDQVNAVAVDPSGNVVVAGNTTSPTFPTANALQPWSPAWTYYAFGSPVDYPVNKGFLAKLPPTLASLTFSTYTGGSINCCDSADSVAVDGAGDIYMSGFSRLDTYNRFTSVRPYLDNSVVRSRYDIANYGGEANYVAAYSRDGAELRFRSYAAGCDFVNVFDPTSCQPTFIAARDAGQVFVGGSTLVNWVPIAALNTQAVHKNPGLRVTGFLTRLSFEPPALVLGVSNASPVGGALVTLTARSYAAGATGSITYWDGATQIGSAPMVEGVARFDATFSAGVRRLSAKWNTTTSPTLLVPVVLP